MQLMREAHFGWVFIGIETPDEAALKLTRKMQNMSTDILGSLRRIYAHGIDVLAGFIVGFDTDTLETFERQRRFILDSGIQAAMVGLLTALPRTPLYERLQREGRLIDRADDTDNTRPGTNIVPLNMEYHAMVDAYQALYRALLTDAGIARRIRNKMRWLRAPVYRGEYTVGQRLSILAHLLVRGILPGGPSRWMAFLSTLPRSPRQFPAVIADWITGLSMREYVWRRFGATAGDDAGTVVVAAHVDSVASAGLGPFAELRNLAAGDVVTVTRADGARVTYAVTSVVSTAKPEVTWGEVFVRDGPHRLVLVTCGGVWHDDRQSYSDNVVVTAEPIDG